MGGLTPLVFTVLVSGISRPAAGPTAGDILPPLLPPLLSWRAVFWAFGLVGVVWCVVFALSFRNRPEEKPEVNAAELAMIRAGGADSLPSHVGVPWRRILTSPNLWLLWLSYSCLSYCWWFYMTYLPDYLEQTRDVPAASILGAVGKGGPLCMGALGCIVGGLLTDWFIRRSGSRRWGRRLFGVLGYGLTALCFLSCGMRPGTGTFLVMIALAGFFTDITMASSWATCQDIGKGYAAIVAGFMNMIGNFGGAAANWIFGFILERSLAAHAQRLGAAVESLSHAEKNVGLEHGYQINFLIMAAVSVIAALCWLRIDATRPIATEVQD